MEDKYAAWSNVLDGGGTEQQQYDVGNDIGNFIGGLATGGGLLKLFKQLRKAHTKGIPRINGKRPQNHGNSSARTAGGIEIQFDSNRFPDFTPHSAKTVRVKELTGNYRTDEIKALSKAKMRETPEDMVWHHHQDGKSMMLVPKNIHNKNLGGVAHTGGAAVIKHNQLHPDNQLSFPSPPIK